MTAVHYPISARTLDNGVRVVVSPDHAVPTVSLNLWIDVGSRHEQPGRTGLAHLFEHLMFQGSQHVAQGEFLSELMAHGGRANATTWFDRTNYFATVPTGALELALWMESDRQLRLLPALGQQNLDTQRAVVAEEKSQRYDNQPYGSVLADLAALAFEESHPYHHCPIGSMSDLETVHEFYRYHYGANSTVLTLCGDIEPEKGFDLAQRYFGQARPRLRPDLPRGEQLPPLSGVPEIEHVGEVPRERLYLLFRLPRLSDPRLTAAAIALDVLAGLAISRLHRTLVRELESCTSVSASVLGLVDGASIGYLGADIAPDHRPESVEQTILEALTRLADEGPTEVELHASKADTRRSWLEAAASVEERADLISKDTLLHQNPHRLNGYLERVGAVDAEAVRSVTREWMAPSQRARIVFRQPASGTSLQPSAAGGAQHAP